MTGAAPLSCSDALRTSERLGARCAYIALASLLWRGAFSPEASAIFAAAWSHCDAPQYRRLDASQRDRHLSVFSLAFDLDRLSLPGPLDLHHALPVLRLRQLAGMKIAADGLLLLRLGHLSRIALTIARYHTEIVHHATRARDGGFMSRGVGRNCSCAAGAGVMVAILYPSHRLQH
jgi:hypothetical protein